jgi:pilus assembly protein Flp/PilA
LNLMLGLYLNARNFATSRLAREEKGATAVEYGIMVALIAVAIVGAVVLLGDGIGDLFTSVDSCLDSASAGTVTAAGDCTP